MGERKKKGMVEVREKKRGVERCSDPHESRSSPSSREGGIQNFVIAPRRVCLYLYVTIACISLSLPHPHKGRCLRSIDHVPFTVG